MADAKISALPASTTPLTGSEVVPVVQSGTTKKVSVANLTAGRDVSVAGFTASPSGAYQSVGIGSGSTYGVISFNGLFGVNTALGIAGGANGDNSTYVVAPTTVFHRIGSTNITSTAATGFNIQSGDLGLFVGNINQGTAAKGVNFTANTPAAGMTSQLLNWYEEGTWTPTVSASSGAYTTVSVAQGSYTRIGRQVTLRFNFTVSDKGTGANGFVISGLPFTANGGSYSGSGFNASNATGIVLYGVNMSTQFEGYRYDGTDPVVVNQSQVGVITYFV